MIKNNEFIVSLNTNTYYFRHFDLNHFTLLYNGKPIPSEGLSMNRVNENTYVLAYNTLHDGSGIRHSNAGLQLTHDMFLAGYFMLLFDLTPDRFASEGHISLPDQGTIRLEHRFDKQLPESVTCLPYLEYDISALIYELARCVNRLIIMDTSQILCTLKNVLSFLGVYPSDMLPPPWVTRSATLIVNSDPHTNCLAVHLQPQSYSGYFFDCYGLPPLFPNIMTFFRRTCTVW